LRAAAGAARVGAGAAQSAHPGESMTSEAAGVRASRRSAAAKVAASSPSTPWPATRVAYYTCFLLILSTAVANLDTAIVPYLITSIKHDLHLTDTSIGLLMGASFGLFYTIVGLPIAWFLDRYSRKWILAVAISVWSVGTALCGVAQNYAQLFASRFLVGAGEAVNGPATYAILSDLFPRERLPRAIAIMKIGTILGPALSLLISFFLLKAFLGMRPIPVPFGQIHGWQLVFVLVGLPGVLVTVLMLASMPEPSRRIISGQMRGYTARQVTGLGSGVVAWFQDFWVTLVYIFRHWQVFVPMFAALFVSSLGQGSATWMPAFYERTFGWGPAKLAGLNFIPAFLLAPLGLYVGVKMAEHFAAKGRDDAALWTQIVGRLIGLPALFAVLAPSPWITWGLSGLTIFVVSVAAPAQNAAFQIVTPTEHRGKMTALFLFIFSVVGVAFAPIITAWITDHILKDESQIRWAIFIPAIVFGPTSLVITWLGLKPYEREVQRLKALEAAR
jgi:MFS family permease